jgi:voltage-gated potassium channel
MNDIRRRLLLVSTISVFIVTLGTAWYTLMEDWPVLDAVYMTVITLTTVGFGEVRPLSAQSRAFTIVLILMGVGTVAYGLSSLGEYLLASGFVERVRRRTLLRTISRMKNHIIICGAGRVGTTAAETLQEIKRPFVIIDPDLEVVEAMREEGWTALAGDSTRDDVLLEAGIESAAGILVSTGNDSDNLFIVLSARTLNQDLLIVARSVDASSEAKMRRAGADKVVSPYKIGGRQMANLILRPNVAEFMDHVTLDTGLELWLEEVTIAINSPVAGQTVVEADMRRRTGVTLVALLRGSERILVTPDESTRFEVGDELIALGTRSQLRALEDLIGSPLGSAAEPAGAKEAS